MIQTVLENKVDCFFLIEDILLCLNSKVKQNVLQLQSKQQQYINISILLWQHVSVLLDHPQASIQRYDVQSVHIM